jgi:hypothetical protein
MKKRFSVIVLAISMLLGFGTLSFGQCPDISGHWLFDLSGTLQGGALITVTASTPDCNYTFEGFGVGLAAGGQDGNRVLLSGQLLVDEKGKITGAYEVTGLEEWLPAPGTLTGKVDKKIGKLSFKFKDGLNGKAIKLPDDPNMPSSWTATSNKGGKVALDLTIDPDTGYPNRMYTMEGTGTTEEGDVSIIGGFFLSGKSVAYGWYTVSAGGEPIEEGLFFGKMKLTPGKSSFSFKLTGYDDEGMSKGVLKGTAK